MMTDGRHELAFYRVDGSPAAPTLRPVRGG
jgi:hypothetical protein